MIPIDRHVLGTPRRIPLTTYCRAHPGTDLPSSEYLRLRRTRFGVIAVTANDVDGGT